MSRSFMSNNQSEKYKLKALLPEKGENLGIKAKKSKKSQ